MVRRSAVRRIRQHRQRHRPGAGRSRARGHRGDPRWERRRRPRYPVRGLTLTDPAEVAAAATGQDAIVSAIGPRRGVDDQEEVLVGAPRGLIAGARGAGVRRVIVVGGGGSLLVASGERLLDTPDFPAAWRPGALAQAAALELYRAAGDLDWTYISPPFLIEAGESERARSPRRGRGASRPPGGEPDHLPGFRDRPRRRAGAGKSHPAADHPRVLNGLDLRPADPATRSRPDGTG